MRVARRRHLDRTVYRSWNDTGEGTLQRLVSELLRGLIDRWLRDRGRPAFVGANQFFYWRQFDASERIAPDVYVLPGAPLAPRIDVWKVWETGLVPSFAFELVSSDADEEYLRSLPKYARLEVDELLVFDPDYEQSRCRSRWQVYRKGRRGLAHVESTDADRVRSKVLGCHLRAVGTGGDLRIRLATGFNGETLVLTDKEARARAETGEQAALAALERERPARAALQAEIAELRTTKRSRERTR